MLDKQDSWLKANYRLVLVLVLLLAAVLRLYGLNNLSPPGLEHDEVAHWLINQDILNGDHGLYFTGAYGHEAGFHYFQSGFIAMLGDNVLALRLPSAYLGLLLVAVSFALARRLFGLTTAVMSAALLAVLFWPVFYSRLALRAISLISDSPEVGGYLTVNRRIGRRKSGRIGLTPQFYPFRRARKPQVSCLRIRNHLAVSYGGYRRGYSRATRSGGVCP